MATYASLITLERNILEHIHESDDLKPLHEKVVELKDRCSQATLPSEDVELKIRRYAYRASNIIEDLYLQPLHRTRDELRNLDEEASRLVDEARTFMDATDHPSTELMEHKQVSLKGLKKLLYDHNQRQLEFISILGMGGSGKTTIANHFFEQQRTRDHFDCQAWITVPQNYEISNFFKHTLLSQILRDLKEPLPENGEDASFQDLEQKVYHTLIRRRYLIVIDNVWHNDIWDFINLFLPDNAKASRVLLTTREDDVAAYFVTSTSESYIHKVKKLDEDQSWSLLKEKVFGKDEDCPDELENSGKSIAEDCGGLPLSIVVIAGVLSNTMNEESWENVADDVSHAIQIGSSGEVERILGLSYTKLPHHLKPCFLYLACFPEGYKIEVSKLIMLWIAERFLKLEPPEWSPEEVAYEYLDDLVNRNLVMVSKMNDDKIELCYLHDQIRSMCVEKAKEENFVCEFYGDRILSSDEIENKIRFSIYSKDFVTDYQHRDRQILRSTHYFPNSCQVPLMSCTHLQVLDAGGILFPEFPEQVCQLHLLKYLALRIKENFEVLVVEVPPCIIHLRNLQVFRVEGFDGLKIELPLEIWEMSKLRHLTFFGESKAIIPDPPAGTSSFLTNLQTMCSLVDFKFTEEVRIRIPEVKELDIEYNDEEDRYCLRDLDQLESLETLRIRNGIPSQNIRLPRKLKHLTLSRCGFPWSEIGEVVGSLPNLEVLKLKDNACVGDEWEVKEGEFPELRVLEIDETELRVWRVDDIETNIFPSLELLKLYKCKYLKDFPSGIGRIHTLTLIKVDEILRNWASKVVEEQEDNGYGDVEMSVQKNIDDVIKKQLQEDIEDEDSFEEAALTTPHSDSSEESFTDLGTP